MSAAFQRESVLESIAASGLTLFVSLSMEPPMTKALTFPGTFMIALGVAVPALAICLLC
jgi:hypothetical protein